MMNRVTFPDLDQEIAPEEDDEYIHASFLWKSNGTW